MHQLYMVSLLAPHTYDITASRENEGGRDEGPANTIRVGIVPVLELQLMRRAEPILQRKLLEKAAAVSTRLSEANGLPASPA